MLVVFDIPVDSTEGRREATKFRNVLLDNGFTMMQYSVYIRHTAGKEIFDRFVKIIKEYLPECGDVSILEFTDKQYEKILSFSGKKKKDKNKGEVEQLTLF